jgi:hypothetical protein
MARYGTIAFAVFVAAALGLVSPAAGDTANTVGRTVTEAALTGGHAVRDGALTLGRTTRAFFESGTLAAKETWDANADRTKGNARAGGRATRRAAQGE